MAKIQRTPPPYVQISTDIREQIHSGQLRPGDVLPSARRLAEDYGVSRATVDKALAGLRAEGIIRAVPRVGTVVADQVPGARVQSGGMRFRRMLTTGRATKPGERSEILSADLVPAPENVAAALRVEAGSPVIRRRRQFIDDGGVAALSTSWLPGDLAKAVPALLRTERIEGGTIGAISAATGRHPAPGTDTAMARLATEEEAADLGLDTPAAVLVVEARLADEDGVPLEYGVDVIGPGRPWTVGYDLGQV